MGAMYWHGPPVDRRRKGPKREIDRDRKLPSQAEKSSPTPSCGEVDNYQFRALHETLELVHGDDLFHGHGLSLAL
jgi:hypothetical protein